MKHDSGRKTLLTSMLLSAPGPMILALGLRAGHSSTQVADLVRRSAELAAIAASFIVYCITVSGGAGERKARLERLANWAVGAAMCLGGGIMLGITLLSGSQSEGSSLTGLIIAVMGVVANSLFYVKYTRLSRESGNAILQVQRRLYRAKAAVDACVTIALLAVTLAPGSAWAGALDAAGTAVVAVYLMWCGVKTIRESG